MQTWLLFSGCIVAWGVAIFLMKVAGSAVSPHTAIVFSLPGYILAAAFVMFCKVSLFCQVSPGGAGVRAKAVAAPLARSAGAATAGSNAPTSPPAA